MNKIIIIAGGLVLALILFFLLVWPTYQNLQTLNNTLREKESALTVRENYYSQVKEFSTRLKDYPEALAKITSALPEDVTPASLANFLQTNAAQTGLVFKKIVLGGTLPSKVVAGLQESWVVVQLSGSYGALKNYLSLIEGSSRMIEVQNVSMSLPLTGSKDSPSYSLEMKTYSY